MACLFGCAVLLLFSTPVSAGNFRFYVGELFPYVIRVGPDGYAGAAVDVVSEIMAEAGSPVEPGDLARISWPRAIDDVESSMNMGIFCMARTPLRENLFKWVGPIAHLKLGLIGRKSSRMTIRNFADLAHHEIGVIRNSGPHTMLTAEGVPAANLTLLLDNEQQFRMLHEGRVDLITQADVAAPYYLREMGLNPDEYEMVYVLKELDLYVAFNKNTPDRFIRRVQAALDAMKKPDVQGSSRFQRILDRYTQGKEN
ncbi:transporter substrate-binding domain-containing protein [Pseudodesulfovibrio cashew]|uniref:Transporter substrate-binding domain-containing protein n=1 Tax=Pseudodesulfovibrio cashew TaxID=2678688 RepID=A0A6I6JKG9_9BACT|nr:transporter substrate-binding domain-containing protein [Pseudodesulfovibrio cashew]QGY40802.1 transporter substrate-binding domain-containing protein [Pseudodesulfovibrio cashew]